MLYFETCKKDIKINAKSSHIKSATHIHIEHGISSRLNNNFTDKLNTRINPRFEQVDNLGKRTVADCTQDFQRFK